MPLKRVTLTVEIVDDRGLTTWSTTEVQEHSTGDNPRFHWNDVTVALAKASQNVGKTIVSRFGTK